MSIAASLLPELESEMRNTRAVLERIPDVLFNWKIHEKSNTIGWVVNHLSDIPVWGTKALTTDAFDIEPVDGERYQMPNLETTAQVLKLFDENVSALSDHLKDTSDEQLGQTWSLLKQGQTVLQMPRVGVLRVWVLNHTIHHRAHLCVYLRVNDIAVPGMYGPSADDDP